MKTKNKNSSLVTIDNLLGLILAILIIFQIRPKPEESDLLNSSVGIIMSLVLVAILFVLFDVEVIFMYPWAVNFKEMGVEGLIKMSIFMILLLIGFFYVIKKKALVWE